MRQFLMWFICVISVFVLIMTFILPFLVFSNPIWIVLVYTVYAALVFGTLLWGIGCN